VAATDLHRGEGVVDVAPVPRRFAEHLMRGGGTWACVTAARLLTLVSTDFSRHRENSHYIRDIVVKIFLSGVHGVLRVAYWGAGHRHEELELLVVEQAVLVGVKSRPDAGEVALPSRRANVTTYPLNVTV
jgi:hypothetical protein